MDCGFRGKTLRRHLGTRHGLNRDEYLKRWRLPHDHQLTAPAYSERRSMLSKELGLGPETRDAGGPGINNNTGSPRPACKTRGKGSKDAGATVRIEIR